METKYIEPLKWWDSLPAGTRNILIVKYRDSGMPEFDNHTEEFNKLTDWDRAVIMYEKENPLDAPIAVEGKSKAVDEIIKLAHDSRYSDMDKVLSKLGDDVLTKLKENPNHITAQLKEFNEQVSYNTGFHTGFTLGYHASTQPSNKEVQDIADALRDWCDFELNIGGVPIWKNKLDHWLLDNTRLISRSELTMVDNYIEENIIKPLAALSTRI